MRKDINTINMNTDEINYETRDYDGIRWIRYDHYEHALTSEAQKREELLEKVLVVLENILEEEYLKRNPPSHNNVLDNFRRDVHKRYLTTMKNLLDDNK